MTIYRKRKENVHRSTRRIRARRAQLVARLGGKCVGYLCVCDCTNSDNLEFDHIDPASRDWRARDLWSHQRMRKYEEEADAGLLQLLCRSCNARKQEPCEGGF